MNKGTEVWNSLLEQKVIQHAWIKMRMESQQNPDHGEFHVRAIEA